MVSKEQIFSKRPIISSEQINDIVKIFHQIGRNMSHPFFYCELHSLKTQVNWKDRCYLRKHLVAALKTQYKKYRDQLWTDQTSDAIYKEWDRLLLPAYSLQNSIAAISISHCPLLGGFIFSLNPNISIGLDIEVAARVSRQLLYRISHPEEIAQVPDNALLWTAKEAVCKCISLNQLTVLLKDCFISHWTKTDEVIHHFTFEGAATNTNQRINGSKSSNQFCRQSVSGVGSAFRFGPFAFSYAQMGYHH